LIVVQRYDILLRINGISGRKKLKSTTDNELTFRIGLKALCKKYHAMSVDLDEYKAKDIAGKAPVCLFVDGVEYPVNTWRGVYIATCDAIAKRDVSLLHNAASTINNNYFGLKPTDMMRVPHCHKASGIWLNLCLNADTLIRYSKRVFELCGFPIARIGIVYTDVLGPNYIGRPSRSAAELTARSVRRRLSPEEKKFVADLMDVLARGFPRGIVADSFIDLKRLRQRWLEFGLPPYESDDATITKAIMENALDFGKGRYYSPKGLVSDVMMRRILDDIESSFAAGKKAIYFTALYDKFASEIESRIFTPEQLRLVLANALADKEGYVFRESYLTNDPGHVPDPLEEIVEFMRESGRCVTVEQIAEKVDHPVELIRYALSRNTDRIFCVERGLFLLAELVSVEQTELDRAKELIKCSLSGHDFVPSRKLIAEWLAVCPDIEVRNPGLPRKTFWWILKKGVTEFKITESFISQLSSRPPTLGDYLDELYCDSDEISVQKMRDVLDVDFGNEPGLLAIYGEKLFSRFCHVEKDRYVKPGLVNFPVDAIDACLDIVCKGDFMPFLAVGDFTLFPHVDGFKWNPFLLQGFVQHFSKRFKYVGESKALDKCVGALVRRTSPIENQTQIMAVAAAEHIEFGLNNAEELLEWFVEVGYLSSRRFKGIRDVMALAQQERQRKDAE